MILEETDSDTGAMIFAVVVSTIVLVVMFVPALVIGCTSWIGEKAIALFKHKPKVNDEFKYYWNCE